MELAAGLQDETQWGALGPLGLRPFATATSSVPGEELRGGGSGDGMSSPDIWR